jgi:hypothetical protein
VYGVVTQNLSVEKFTAVDSSNFTLLEQFNGGDLELFEGTILALAWRN